MSWENFESGREAKNYNSELYKKFIIRYYQTLGYHFSKNSYFEGTLSDLVMEKKEEIIWIEAKNTKVSIFAHTDYLRKEIFLYLYNWLKLRPKKRFKFVIFASSFSKQKRTKMIFTTEASEKDILNWLGDQDDLDIDEKVLKKINSASKSEIVKFFKNTDIRISTLTGLIEKVKEKEEIIRKSVNSQHKRLLREIRNRKDPIHEKDDLLINFLKVDYPKVFYQAASKYKLKKTFFKKLKNEERVPEFVVPRFEAKEPVVRSFEKNLNPLRPCITGNVYSKETDRLNKQRKRELLYTSLRRYLWCKGLRRWRNQFYFAYDEPQNEKSVKKIDPIKINLKNRRAKQVTKPMLKEDGSINFFEHKSVLIRLEYLDENIGLFIWPSFLFTLDGINVIEGDYASRLHQKYLNPNWNRNPSRRNRLKFWGDFLTSDYFIREKDPWFVEFKINPLLTYTVDWISKTININQQRIDKIFL